VTPRRWLLEANPALAEAITQVIGEIGLLTWPVSASLSRSPRIPALASFFLKSKREAKVRFVNWLRSVSGQTVDPDTVFDCQVKRIHEYKRQLLNALRIVVVYKPAAGKIPILEMVPRTFSSPVKRHQPIDWQS